MTYICIKCRTIWVSGDHTSEYSGGLCEGCTIDYIRDRQKSQDFMIASRKRLNSVQEGVVVTGCCATGS